MYNINMAVYEQMGFTKEQVTKAYQFSQQNNIDIFDALQYLQRNPNQPPKVSTQQKNKPPNPNDKSSLLENIKNIDIKQYEIVFSTKNSRLNLLGKQIDLRQEYSPVGLLNVYNCCYLNSLLQCYFLSTNLMKYIFLAEPLVDLENLQQKMNKTQIKRIRNSYNFLQTLKEIFAKMCLTSRKYIDPTEVLRSLVNSIGEKIQYGEEKDLFETNISVIERLNQCLLYTKNYYKPNSDSYKNQSKKETEFNFNQNQQIWTNKSNNKQRDNIKNLFYGKKVQFTDFCGKNHSSQQIVSDFLGIIINPTHGNLYKAIYEEFHYDVQIEIPDEKRKIKTKKHTYIRQVPEYLYFYINRTRYNARQQQALKNAQKISFDFVIYLDSFLEKYRKESTANMPFIIQLWRKKNQLKKKINSFQIFAKKLEQCRQLASSIDGWKEKLPDEAEVESEKRKIEEELRKIQNELEKIESRKQKYCLMYIFVHRGDAVSGHYWGYGRNGGAWYKFDINTKKIKEEEILLDFYKNGGTPYALVYVKENSLPSIGYHYYKDFSQAKQQHLIDLGEQQVQSTDQSYLKFIPQGMKKVIIAENMILHQDFQKRKNLQITQKLLAEYLARYSYIENFVVEKSKNTSVQQLKIFPLYDNFALYLWSKDLKDFSKYNIFSTSLKSVANISTTQMLENQTLLKLIQKQFKKKVKKNKTLKHYCIEFEPKEGEHYKKESKNFFVEKNLFIFVMNLATAIEKLESCKIKGKTFSNENMVKVNNILKRAVVLLKSGSENISYIRHVCGEILPIALLKFLREKCAIAIKKDELDLLVSENIMKQLQTKGFKESLTIEEGSMIGNQAAIQENGEDLWSLDDIGKGYNQQILQKKIKSVLKLLQTQIKIYQQVQKSGKVIQQSQQDQNSKEQKNVSAVVQESLI